MLSPLDALLMSLMAVVPIFPIAICIREVVVLLRRKATRAVPMWVAALVSLASIPFVLQFPAGFMASIALPFSSPPGSLFIVVVPILLATAVLRYLPLSSAENEQASRPFVIAICVLPFALALIGILILGPRQEPLSIQDTYLLTLMSVVPILPIAICIREVVVLLRRKPTKAVPMWVAAFVSLAAMPFVLQFPAGFLMTVSLPVNSEYNSVLVIAVPVVLTALVLYFLPFKSAESGQAKRIIVIAICLVPFVFAIVDILMFGIRQFPMVTHDTAGGPGLFIA